ncbi:MAG: hypothetical protein LBJ72_10440 [Dysgonamonadaceae bacterium]|nr:hypothetical protein [Dysgonamonadaceae bacterium]
MLYADKVIVQSNKVRDTYIRVFREIEKKNNRPGGFGKLEEKFIALGSPKFDKVIHTKCENCKIPDEWNRLIEKPDGTRKKVILYNTSVSALLKGNEKVLAKLRYTFERFRNRDDAVLWWRPHPMSEATCQSMRPQLHSDYLEIVAKYKRQGFGIYDDTADLHRAIAWSDAYYGDESSIVPLYQVTGKPVMLGNILQQQDQGEFRFLPAYLYAGETDIWFSIRQINALFKMNKNTWESRFVGSFPGEVECITRFNAMLYQTPVENKGVIYFPPFYAKEIAAYSVVDDTFTKFSYKKSGDEEAYHSDFCGAVAYGDYVYFTPYLYPAIVRLDPATGEMDYYSDWIEPLEKRIGDVQDVFFLRPVVVGKSIWLAACGANAVVEFNMETQRSTVNEAGKKGYRYGGICFDGENYWLSPRFFTTTPVVKWNPKMGIIKEFTEIYLDDTEPHGFYPIVYGGGFVWLFPSFSRHPYKIDVHTNIVSIADEFEFDLSDDKNAQSSKECCRYKALTIIDDSIFAYVGSVETIIEYNFVTKERKYKMGRYLAETMAQIKPLLAGAFLTGTGQMKSVYDCCYYEDDVIGLADFLNHLTSETDMDKMGELMNKRMAIAKEINVHVNGTAGQMIYDFIRKAMLG